MLLRTIRSVSAALVCLLLVSAPARAAIINWEYAGAVSSNFTHYEGVNVGDTVTMTIAVDTDAVDLYGSNSSPSVQSCGLYVVPSVTVSFGGLVYQSWSPTLTLNTPAGIPARSPSSARARAEKGVAEAGLTTMVQPAASAGPALRVIIAAGKFHGVIAAHTPIGSLITTMRLSVPCEGIVSP